MELGNLPTDAKGSAIRGTPSKCQIPMQLDRGGVARISVENSVMELERRGVKRYFI